MDRVRVSVSLLAPRMSVAGRQKKRYIGILNQEALRNGGMKAWGPLGGAATIAALPNFRALAEKYHIELCDPETGDLRFWIAPEHVEVVLTEIIAMIPVYGEQDFRRELIQELTGKELRRVSHEQILDLDRVNRIGIRFVRHVCQPKTPGEFVRSQRDKGGAPTKRLFFLYELQVSRRTFRKMRRSTLIREFDPAQLPGADDNPVEPIVLEDGTERRGHLMTF